MAVVTDGLGNPTNLRTSSDEELAWRSKYGSLRPYPGDNKGTTSGSGDPAASRRLLSGLGLGGIGGVAGGGAPPVPDNVKFSDGAPGAGENDWRIRVSINPSAKILYYAETNPGILKILKSTDGVIFPYVPSLTVSHAANYGSVPLTHANYANYFYESSSVSAISINADFTVQDQNEAQYMLAAVYFFRACTKMFFGDSKQFGGSPPPIVYLDGYGAHYLPHVPCVVTSFSHTMPPDVDYMEAQVQSVSAANTPETAPTTGAYGFKFGGAAGNTSSGSTVTQVVETARTRVPTVSTFSLTLQPIYSRDAQRSFDYAAFARGDLISKAGSGGYL
jgi:hypothetical protein